METKYGFFSRLKDSLVTPKRLSTYVIESRNVKSMSYWAILCLLTTLLVIGAMLAKAYPMGSLQKLEDTLPKFELKYGYLDMDLDEPLVYDTGSNLLILENGEPTDILEKYRNYGGEVLYINSYGVYIKSGAEEIPATWTDIEEAFETELNFSTKTLGESIKKWTWVVILLIAPFMYVGSLIGGLFLALVAALIGLIINAVMKTGVGFGRIYILSLYALTVQKLLQTILRVISQLVPLVSLSSTWLLNLLITAVFIGVYLSAYKRSKAADQPPALN